MITKNLVAGYDFTKGTVNDLSGNGNDATMVDSVFVKGRKGNAANGRNGRLSVSHSASTVFDAITIAINGDFQKGLQLEQGLVDKRDAATSDFVIYVGAANTLVLLGSIASSITILPSDLVGVGSIIVTKSAGSSKPKVYLDDAYFGEMSALTEIANNSASMTMLRLHFNVYPVSNNINSILLYTDEKSADDVATIAYDQGRMLTPRTGRRNFDSNATNKVLYQTDFEQTHISNTNISEVGAYIPDTDIQLTAGTLRMTEGDCAEDKALLGSSFGSKGFATHSGDPYGEYYFDVITNGQRLYISPISLDGNTVTSTNLSIDCTGGSTRRIEVSNSLLTSPNDLVPDGKHSLKLVVTNEATNNCTLYLDGALVPAASGSNPFTFTPVVASTKYYVFAPYSGSKICDFVHTQ